MAVTVTLLGSPQADNADLTTYTTVSYTPPTSRVVLAVVVAESTTAMPPPVITGWGVQWSLIGSVTEATRQLSLHRCWTGSSPSPGSLTVTSTAARRGLIYHLVELGGVEPLAPIRRWVSTVGAASTAGTVTMPAASDSAAGFITATVHGAAAGSPITPETGWTELADHTMSTPTVGLQSQVRVAVDDLSPAWTFSTSTTYAAIGVELAPVGVYPVTAAILEYPGFNDTDLASYTTGSVIPPPNRVVALAVLNAKTSSAAEAVSSVTGWGATWTQVATRQFFSGNNRRVSLWTTTTGPSPTTGPVTINFGGVNQISCAWQLIGLGVDPTTPFPQSAVNGSAGGSSVTGGSVTLPGGLGAGAGVLSVAAASTISTVQTAETGYTALARTASGNAVVHTEWRGAGGDTTVDWTWPTSVAGWGLLAVELTPGAVAPLTGDAVVVATSTISATGTVTTTAGAVVAATSTISATGIIRTRTPVTVAVWDPGVRTDDEVIVNIANLTNVADVAVAARNQASIDQFGPQPVSGRTNDQWITRTDGQELAAYLVERRADAYLRVDTFTLYLHDPGQTLWRTGIDLRIGDLIEFVRDQPAAGGGAARLDLLAVVSSIRHEIRPGSWVTTFGTTRATGNLVTFQWDSRFDFMVYDADPPLFWDGQPAPV